MLPPLPAPSFISSWHNTPYGRIDPTLPAHSAAGKTVVVTGGGSGIGPAIAHAFAAAGAKHIVLIGRTLATLESTKITIQTAYPDVGVSHGVADVADHAAVDKLFVQLHADLGPLDVLISNAGYLPDLDPVRDAEPAEWARGHSVNVLGGFNVARAFLHAAAADAVIISVSTGAAHIPAMSGYSSYASSKMATALLFQYVQAENPGMTVINVHPGSPNTDMRTKGSTGAASVIPEDHIDLPAHFMVWTASREAQFLKGKFVWANWDVDDLIAAKEHLLKSDALTVGLHDWHLPR